MTLQKAESVVIMPFSWKGGTHPQKNAVGVECSPAGNHRGWLQVHPVLEQAVQRAVQQWRGDVGPNRLTMLGSPPWPTVGLDVSDLGF